ncbi:uncharacterized protein LOC111886844 isoform X1 [Lactuca sativa]|uniref:uncharacterized protein LOC111886844 isoform X1 n=1 Tax=Lactuca sativa TaxID=4236 RepID=UPI000CD8002B|nr:uncharacterized protein LOC111886844 isoform X1 [Lactuca sativa]XP_023738862.1 uncharacterized protein LOC111886844 isoform X1 [Lactuca sativa]
MWRIKQFMPKEKSGLEGRMIDIGNLKIQVRNVIAEGGFSCVYLAQDALNGSKQYALKHMICNDEESLDLVKKEISVMKSLQGHPNIVMLCAHTFLDTGRTKEALLVMEFCDKSLVNVLESRGAGFFEEKQILQIFRDVCNAVFAMHCQSPPIAHRDLKAENILLGSDGLWKLCDFGSTSTNHKRFERPEEMGIEEDNIRKHTTPAYRSPEMWDLLLREVISEKVDIWALGCLLFRICYFKSAFDGESKLQVLNGNYRIPEMPKYSSSITDLIKDMLQSFPSSRPDITQVWFRVNGLLPDESQKSLPDRPPEMLQADIHEGLSKPANKSSPVPRRSPPPPPTTTTAESSRNEGSGGPMGAFWTTQHAKESAVVEELKFDEEASGAERFTLHRTSPPKNEGRHSRSSQKMVQGKSGPSKDFEMNFFPEGGPKSNDGFNAFASEFGMNRVGKEEELEGEVERLREELKQVNMEKNELISKYEKLSAICRSQRQELHELKQQTLASTTPSSNKSSSKTQPSPGIQHQSPSPSPQQKEKDGRVWEVEKGLFDKGSPVPSLSPEQNSWQAFPEENPTNNSKSVRTRNGHQNKPAAEGGTTNWGFGAESFTAVPAAAGSHSQANTTPNISTTTNSGRSRYGEDFKNKESKSASRPAGWAGF